MSILDEEGQRQQVQPRFLDLSGMHISTKEELQNIMFKMLEMRLRPDKLSEDEVNRIIYCESCSPSIEYPFLDPIPASMRDVDLSALSQVDIDWKMLTLARPNTKQEMEIFTRFVELEKLKLKSLCQEDEKAEARVTAIKPKVQADGFEQETNSDEFTYDYFSRRLAAEEMPHSEDSKKMTEPEKRKLSQKLDSVVSRQETFPEAAESPSPVPDIEPETKRKLSAKKTKKMRKRKVKRRKRKKRRRRRIKRLRNGRVVFVTVRRRKKWYTLKKKKRKNKGQKKVSASKESETKPSNLESTTGEVDGTIPDEIKDDVPSSETRESSAKSQKSGRRKKTAKVPMSKKASGAGEKGVKAKKHNLSNASKTDIGAPKSVTTRRRVSISKHVKGAASRVLAKRGTFTRSVSIRHTKTVKVARLKIKQTARARKESTKAKLDADGEGIELDEIAKEGCATEEDDFSAKLSSSESGTTKMNVKNRRSFKTLIKANRESKRTADSPPEKPSQDSKESNKDKNLPK